MPLKPFVRLLRDETGATAIEYALIGGAIALVIVVSAQTIGTGLNTIFTTVATGLK
jgi:pilus assembly protein Flp/PilA